MSEQVFFKNLIDKNIGNIEIKITKRTNFITLYKKMLKKIDKNILANIYDNMIPKTHHRFLVGNIMKFENKRYQKTQIAINKYKTIYKPIINIYETTILNLEYAMKFKPLIDIWYCEIVSLNSKYEVEKSK